MTISTLVSPSEGTSYGRLSQWYGVLRPLSVTVTSNNVLYQITAVFTECFLTVSVVYGTGNHQGLLTPSDLMRCNLWSWIGQIMAIISLVFGRFAVIAFLFALQAPIYPRWRLSVFFVGAAQAIINIIEIGLILHQCTPTRKLWDPSVQGTCYNIEICSKVGFLQGSIGAFSDAFLALYPIVFIAPLQQKTHTKVGLCLALGGGLIASGAGIVKTYQISAITHAQDITYAILDLLIFVSTEMWLIMIFGSLPTVCGTIVTKGKNMKARATGQSHISELSGSGGTSHHARSESWIVLSSVAKQYGSRVAASAGGPPALSITESEEQILQPRLENEGIKIIREITIESEQEMDRERP
ncbi:hypothetical protein LTR82_018238 [Friedmanniomyces endolithicus]|uniref:Rhodopsin domain-containing protein n=1 Tax=Friedmanniomyces endolithicus TaxID=329885 RepID=A0AAN6F503_9PEZI|nr:hypothetical protein LTR82_018238 [Friedmanniomyces endolithicus]